MTSENPAPATPEQIRAFMKSHYAFGLPNGSVRALLAMGTFGAIWAWMWRRPDIEVPSYLRDLMFIIMGHYFAARRQEATDVVGPAPLFLPSGTVRTVLLLGFATLAGALIYTHRIGASDQGHARLSHAGVTLILVAGFMLGVLISHLRRHGVSRHMEDVRAVISLTAGVLLILMVFGFVHVPDAGKIHEFKRWALYYRVEDILAALVGFYFGSKS